MQDFSTRHYLTPLFEPRSVAIVGASPRAGSPGLRMPGGDPECVRVGGRADACHCAMALRASCRGPEPRPLCNARALPRPKGWRACQRLAMHGTARCRRATLNAWRASRPRPHPRRRVPDTPGGMQVGNFYPRARQAGDRCPACQSAGKTQTCRFGVHSENPGYVCFLY